MRIIRSLRITSQSILLLSLFLLLQIQLSVSYEVFATERQTECLLKECFRIYLLQLLEVFQFLHDVILRRQHLDQFLLYA